MTLDTRAHSFSHLYQTQVYLGPVLVANFATNASGAIWWN